MLSKVNDFILEAWLLPLMYPGTPWCRFFVLNLRILVDHGIRVALGCQQIPGLVNGGPHGSSGLLDDAASAAAPR